MFEIKSLLDQEYTINEKDWVIAILRCPARDPEHAFLMIEGLNDDGTLSLTRYDCKRDPDNENQFKVDVERRVVQPEEGKKTYMNLLYQQEVVGKTWFIRKSAAETLHSHIEHSKKNPGPYNKLGDVASFPRMFGRTEALTNNTKKWLKDTLSNGVISQISNAATMAVAYALQVSFKIPASYTIALTVPSEIQEAITDSVTESSCVTTEAICGPSAKDTIKALTLPPGNNSFTWARNMLYSINDDEIIRTLPMKLSDLINSVASRHLRKPEKKGEKPNLKLEHGQNEVKSSLKM